jgi:hypothetical protein
MLRRLAAELVDQAEYVLTLVRLTVLDWPAGPLPETSTDRSIEKKASGYPGRFRMSILTIHAHGHGGDFRPLLARRQPLIEHGAGAELEAARRQDLMLDRGDDEGRPVWMLVRRAIEALRAPPLGKPN